ncbi:MAG: hypothetical protein AAGC64_06090 [Bacteroidota bacterium]
MSSIKKLYSTYFNLLLSEGTRKKGESVIITISIVSFLIHVLLIFLVDQEIIVARDNIGLLNDPIAAIYTPFSFILIYEVYLLVYHLPKSTSYYIGKQYEIITLIVIRNIFKDLASLDFTTSWFQDKYDLQFTYDIVTTLILFFLIYYFHRLNKKDKVGADLPQDTIRLIERKKIMALVLVPVFLVMATYSLSIWAYDSLNAWQNSNHIMNDLNTIFFDEFFTILILADVLLLLFSLFHTDRFSSVIRNSGFIISTILIRMSFGTEGLLKNILVIVAVLFGVLILLIFNQYRRLVNH